MEYILLRANSIEGVSIADIVDYPEAEMLTANEFRDALSSQGEEDIFMMVLPAGTDGFYERIDSEYGIQ